ncbi:succinylglutamate desuccinylase/aspartoacylase family protein [Burkholderia sp. YI23]|nr:succinylglutamate desuccinylase/aspartoacylase family protein [Burkholderia sp. YI23]
MTRAARWKEQGLGLNGPRPFALAPELRAPCRAGEHKAQGTRHKAQGTRHKAQGTRHKAQGTRHKAQGTRHKAQGTRHKAQGTARGGSAQDGRVTPAAIHIRPHRPMQTKRPWSLSSQGLFHRLPHSAPVAPSDHL